MHKIVKYIPGLLSVMVLSSCFSDKGNYDYTDINEIEIGKSGFETPYVVRADVDELTISPTLVSNLDPDFKGNYSYEWVAVSTRNSVGTRHVIGNERELRYKVKLPPDDYNIFFRVTDLDTDIMFSQSVPLTVNGSYTRGWLVACEDQAGNLVLDMMSISRDTLHLENILKAGLTHRDPVRVWVDNSPESFEENVYVCTAHDTYLYDRESFSKAEELRIFDPDSRGYRSNIVTTDIMRIKEKRTLSLSDGQAYVNTSLSGGEYGTPSNYYLLEDGYDYFPVGSTLACNHTNESSSAGAVDQYVLYNTRDARFCYLQPMARNFRDLTDKDTQEAFSWNTKNDFGATGLEFVTTVNSMFSGGQSATILRNPVDGSYHIYTYTISRMGGSVTKGARYAVPAGTPGFGDGMTAAMTTRQGYLIFASGDTLYGYDFRKGNTPVALRTFPGEVITAVYGDIVSEQCMDDFFYVATYHAGATGSRGGTIHKYSVEDTPERISVKRELAWTGFPRVVNMHYKQF